MPSIIITGADASASLDFALPFDGIDYLNFFDSAASLTRNLMRGKPQPTVAGAPVMGAGFVSLTSQSAFINTGVGENAQITLISASRRVDAANPIFIGNYGSSSLEFGGASLFTGAANVTGGANRNNGGVSALATAVVNADPNVWSVKAMRVTATQLIVDDLTRGLQTVLPLQYPRAVSANLMRVGSGYSGNYIGKSDHLAALKVSRAISDAELARIYAMVQARAAKVGITV